MKPPTPDDLAGAFADPPNVAVFAAASVLSGATPALFVTHESEDGAWQFLSGDTTGTAEIRVVALRTMLAVDPTLVEVADLPFGWMATRASRGEPWTRREGAEPE